MIFESRKVTERSAGIATANFYNITQVDEMIRDSSFDIGLGIADSSTSTANQQSQGVAALLVMLAVLFFIFAYCCWGTPFCRNLCKKYCCCHLEDPERDVEFDNIDEQGMVATPTIILLPHGRMLVVDGTIFSQFQADNTGLDLVELSESVIRSQRNPRTVTRHQLQSSASFLTTDGESQSKDSSWSLSGFPPPTYESIYGKEEGAVPPSYSDILLHRFATLPYDIDMRNAYNGSKEELEMRSLGSGSCPHIISNPINNPYAMANNFSGQSIACALSRNPSLISNPLDSYYVNNEMGCFRNEEDDPRVNSHLNINTISSLYNRADSNSNSNSNSREELEYSRNERRHRISISEEDNYQNEIINVRNISRDEPDSNFRLEVDQSFRNYENERNRQDLNENRYNVRTTREGNLISRSRSEVDSIASEEPSDFQVLADIRESRV